MEVSSRTVSGASLDKLTSHTEAITETAESLDDEDMEPLGNSGSFTTLGYRKHGTAERSFSGDSAMRDRSPPQHPRSSSETGSTSRSSADSSRGSMESLSSQVETCVESSHGSSSPAVQHEEAQNTAEEVSNGWALARGRGGDLNTIHSGLPDTNTLCDVENSGDSAASLATRRTSGKERKAHAFGKRSSADRGDKQPGCMCIIS